MDDTPFAGDRVLITGASAGIGEATARALAVRGADLALVARRSERLVDLADDIESTFGTAACVCPADVTDQSQVEDTVDTAVDALGGLDGLVNNAGVIREEGVETLSSDAYNAMSGVNVDGAFYTTRACLPHLRESSGSIVFTGSNAGVYPYPPNPVYAATKWWIRGFAHSLAARVESAVSVSVVNPSTTRTEIGGEDGEPNVEAFEPGEKLEPDQVADAVAFALGQDPPDAVNELNLFRQDEIGRL